MISVKLFIHEIIHILLSVLAAGFTWRLLPKKRKYFRKRTILVILGAFLGEFLLDTDHLFDYMLAYGLHFRFDYFLKGNIVSQV